MSWWAVYFFAKIGLFYKGLMGFHFWVNLLFAILIITMHRIPGLWRVRTGVAIMIGVVLAYYDSYLPSFNSVWVKRDQLAGFSLPYLMELIGRVIRPEMLLVLIGLMFLVWLTKKRLRMGTFVFLAIFSTQLPFVTQLVDPQGLRVEMSDEAPLDDELDLVLATFFEDESSRHDFTISKPSEDFDVIILSICSLSWDDLKAVKQMDNPLFQKFHVVFNDFNSAASYSGPAIIRLLRASGGQQAHKGLYSAPLPGALLFENLAKSGYTNAFAMNHNGIFGNLINEIRQDGKMNVPLMKNEGLPPYMKSFDGTVISNDYDVLNRWWENRQKSAAPRVALFYNTITLHDGNRLINQKTSNSTESYEVRLGRLIQDLDRFVSLVAQSGRRAMIVVVPEHGAAIHRRANEIEGLREIPDPLVTHVPVGVIMAGMNNPGVGRAAVVNQPTSYLALSGLISNSLNQSPYRDPKVFSEKALAALPSTRFVAENEETLVMRYGRQYYLHTPEINWVPLTDKDF